MTEMDLRNMIAEYVEIQAKSGSYYEWSTSLNKLIDTYNAYPNIGRGIQYKPSLGGWCALYASVPFIMNGLPDLIQPEIGAYEMEANAKKAGIFKKRTSGYIPKRGDLIHYAYPRRREDGTPFTQYHVGIVTNASATECFTTEGNVEHRVMMRQITNWLADTTITGFTAVDYASKVYTAPELPPIPSADGEYLLGVKVTGEKGKLTWIRQ